MLKSDIVSDDVQCSVAEADTSTMFLTAAVPPSAVHEPRIA